MTGPAEDRRRWNARYEASPPVFEPHPLVAHAFAAGLPEGPVLELACGPSGNALAFAAAGRRVVAVDIADVALAQLAAEARRRALAGRVRCVEADVPSYEPGLRFALVLATRYWDPAAFRTACGAVLPGGLLAWEALSEPPGAGGEPRQWRVRHGELSARLPAEFSVLAEEFHGDSAHGTSRVLARSADPGTLAAGGHR